MKIILNRFRRKLTDRYTIITVLLTLLVLILFATYVSLYFRSFSRALAYSRGDRIFVDNPNIVLDKSRFTKTRTLNYIVTNLTNAPIEILGTQISCSCISIDKLPSSLVPFQTIEFQVIISIPKDSKNFGGSIRIFTDDPYQKEMALSFTGQISDG
jgi:hypothetical protein